MRLRRYQQQVIHELREGFRAGHLRQVLALATGSGKTVVASHLIKTAAGKGHRSLFIVDRIELVGQAVQHLEALGLAVGILQAENTWLTSSDDCVVASIQTIRSRSAPPSGLVIIDEVHILHRAHIELMKSWDAVPFIGLSATPLRVDLGKYFTNLVRGPSVLDLTMAGDLVPCAAFSPSQQLLDQVLADVAVKQGDYVEKELGQVLNRKELIGDIVSTWQERGENRKTLAFAVDVAHSKSIVAEFLEAGIPAAHVDGYMPKPERDEIIQKFRNGEYQVLSSVNVLGIGFDCPEVSCGILARPTLSEALDMQQKGRLIRPAPGKECAIILDHAGNCVRFGVPVNFIVPDLQDKDRPSTRAKRKQRKLAICRECGAVLEPKVEECPSCGTRRPIRQADVEYIDSSLVNYNNGRADATAPSSAEKKRWWQGFKWHVRDKQKKPGYAYFLYRDKFQSNPPNAWKYLDPVEPEADIIRWIRHRNIRYAKRRRAS